MTFKLNRPVETDQPAIHISPGLAPGTYRFSLTVHNRFGQRSKPAVVTVNVVRAAPGRAFGG